MPEPSMSVFPPRTESRPAPAPTFREARDLLSELADAYNAAKTRFVWPRPEARAEREFRIEDFPEG